MGRGELWEKGYMYIYRWLASLIMYRCSLVMFINMYRWFASLGFLHSSNSKESACNAGDLDLSPGSGRCPGEGNDNPFQYSCLKNPMERGAWQATDHEITRVGHDLVTKPPPEQKLTQLCNYSPIKKKKVSLHNNVISWSYKKNLFHSYKKESSLFFLRS